MDNQLNLLQPDANLAATFIGNGGVSTDGLGTDSIGTIQAEIPGGSIIEYAFLHVATRTFDNPFRPNNIGFEGVSVPITFLDNVQDTSSGINFETGRVDVTDIVASVVGNRGGVFNFNVDETITGSPELVEGTSLTVIYSNPNSPEQSIFVWEGGLTGATPQTNFLTLDQPIDTSTPNFTAEMALGIQYGFLEDNQFSTIDVNGERLSSSAGDFNDGGSVNGTLITVGGVGDSPDNPANPFENRDFSDDEFYNLAPFLETGDNIIRLDTANPSNDDSIFLSVLSLSGVASVGNNITPEGNFGGRLTQNDSFNPTRPNAFVNDYFLVAADDWDQVQINLESEDFDTYLQLINAETGELITFDDDGGEGLNSELTFAVYPGIDYLVRVTSYGEQATGEYTLTSSLIGNSSSLIDLNAEVDEIVTVDTTTGTTALVAADVSFGDIAITAGANPRLFGVTNNQLYEIDPGSNSTSLIGNLGISTPLAVALDFAPNGVLYGLAGSGFYTINIETGAATLISNLESNFTSSGDLIFDPYNNQFWATSTGSGSDRLFSIDLAGNATEIGSIGFGGVWGLFLEEQNLYGGTSNGDLITINTDTGVGNFNLDVAQEAILGAASLPSINLVLSEGEESTVVVNLPVPDNNNPGNIALPLDVFLLQDLSGSFEDDLGNLQSLVPNLVSSLRNFQANTQFGISSFVAPDNYVYRQELALTSSETEFQSVINDLSIQGGGTGEGAGETQLAALEQVALTSDELGFRDGSYRVAIIATDEPFTQVEGNPNYPSIEQVRDELLGENIIPIFAVAPNSDYPDILTNYQGLVNDLGFGDVVNLNSDSSNIVSAITQGLEQVSSTIEIEYDLDDDEFGYIQSISPNQFVDVLPGEEYTYTVTLGSDGTGGDDTIRLFALGYGETVLNISTEF